MRGNFFFWLLVCKVAGEGKGLFLAACLCKWLPCCGIMRRLSGPSVELQRWDSQSSRGWLKGANEQEGRRTTQGQKKDCDNKSMEIQRKYDNYQWEVSVKQEWRDKQTEMEMVEENVIAIGEIIIMVRQKRKDHWHEKTWFYLIWWNFGPEGRKRDRRTSEHCTAVIYELITALQLTSKYFFTYLSIKRPFFPLQHLVAYLVLIFISVTVLSSGAISGAGLWHNALKCSDSPKNST